MFRRSYYYFGLHLRCGDGSQAIVKFPCRRHLFTRLCRSRCWHLLYRWARGSLDLALHLSSWQHCACRPNAHVSRGRRDYISNSSGGHQSSRGPHACSRLAGRCLYERNACSDAIAILFERGTYRWPGSCWTHAFERLALRHALSRRGARRGLAARMLAFAVCGRINVSYHVHNKGLKSSCPFQLESLLF